MSDLKKIYSVSLKCERVKANEKVRNTQKAYDLLKDKNSDYACILNSMLFLYKESAEVYNNAPSEIVFDHEAF